MWNGPGIQQGSTYIKITFDCGQTKGLALGHFMFLGMISRHGSTQGEKRYSEHEVSSLGL